MDVYAIVDTTGKVIELFFGHKQGEVIDEIFDWETWYTELYNQKCIHVSNYRIRKLHSIALGQLYHEVGDLFVFLQPFPSWTLDSNHDWQPPIPMPDDGKPYNWNEETLTWVE